MLTFWGPYPTPSIQGHKYFLTLVDEKSKYTWLKLMKTKAETRQHLIDFIALVETQFHKVIKIIRSDNGLEFAMPSFFQSKGIIHHTSCVETPQQNGVVERKHQHILNIARSLMFQSHLPICFWSFSVTHVVHIINMLPTPLLNNHSPHFHIYHAHPDMSNLRVFDTLCFASTLQAHRTKFQPRAKKCIYLGHSFGTKGFLLFDLHTREIFVSRHVIFYETIFPYHDNTSSFSVDSVFPLNLPVIDINSDAVNSAPVSSIPLTESNSFGTEAPFVVSSSINDHSVSTPSSPVSASLLADFEASTVVPADFVFPAANAAPVPVGSSGLGIIKKGGGDVPSFSSIF